MTKGYIVVNIVVIDFKYRGSLKMSKINITSLNKSKINITSLNMSKINIEIWILLKVLFFNS
jgi:hypothetical protein